jgi:hypothetical protein
MPIKTPQKYGSSNNTVETEKDLSTSFGDTLKIGNYSTSIEIVNLTAYSAEKSQINNRKETGINHHQDSINNIDDKIHEIMIELNKLISSSTILQRQFFQHTLDQVPVAAGEYHINFFEWVLAVIRIARKKVEDSEMWLNTIKTKKSKKMGYWRMFEKYGSTFGLSNERVLATQTG